MILNGKTGWVDLDGIRLPMTQWSVNLVNEVEEITNADTGRYLVTRAGISHAELTLEGFWPGILGLTEGSVHHFKLAATSVGPYLEFDGVIKSMTVTVDVRGVAKFSLSSQSEGEYTFTF